MFRRIKYFIRDVLHWRTGSVFLAVFLLALLIGGFWYSLHRQLFDDPMSTVVFDREGRLLGARIAADGQWRFPPADTVPEKFATCLINFEDRHFYRHPGVNPLSLLRAAYQNFLSGKIVSGGSTITMQTIRLSRKGKPRTIFQKVIEIVLAMHLELAKSKDAILAMYASHAPFGGNVVGLQAAAWRYYGRSAGNLSWAEAATLAVLPNAPALIHPGRNREALRLKRDRLLMKLLLRHLIDQTTYRTAIREPLPQEPLPLPNLALHLTDRLDREHKGTICHTGIYRHLQEQADAIVGRYQKIFGANGIHNAAVMVMRIDNGEVMAYVGNTPGDGSGDYGSQVDVITSPRSSGSILKPLLFASMLSDGELLPTTLVADIPTTINSYTPKNFNVSYDGAVPAREALIRSLNVPAVRMLSDYGQQRFYSRLRSMGFSTLDFGAGHYGLSLILGGAEVTLWDLCKVYAGLGRAINSYLQPALTAASGAFPEPILIRDEKQAALPLPENLNPGAIYTTLEAMREVRRPEAEAGWENFLSSYPVAWKTGTSFGFRDAWAVGLTPGYVVGVWVGNADGEGRPGLTGLSAAAPLLFEVFDLLPRTGWFEPPWDDLQQVAVCRQSGMLPSPNCPDPDTLWVPAVARHASICPYHRMVHLDSTGRFRVHAGCYPAGAIKNIPWFVLPPAMAWFYRSRDPFYKKLPPWLPGCETAGSKTMQLVWPDKPARIFIPHELDSSLGKVVFEVAHNDPDSKVFWYVDNDFEGITRGVHKLGLQPPSGKHTLTLVDENGNFLSTPFEIVSRR